MAVNYMDRFLSLVPMKKSQLQLLATTALFISSKLKDNRPFVAHHLVEYTECYVTVMDLLVKLLSYSNFFTSFFRLELPCFFSTDNFPFALHFSI